MKRKLLISIALITFLVLTVSVFGFASGAIPQANYTNSNAVQPEIPDIGEDNPHLHKPVEYSRIDPTCTKEGVSYKKCECGFYEIEESIPVAEHDYKLYRSDAATCTGVGKATYVCSCGNKKEEAIPATGHINTIVVDALKATCTDDGYTGDTKCLDCNKIIERGSTINKTNHISTSVVNKKEVTCIADGYTGDVVCNDCNITIKKGSSIKSTGHNFILSDRVEPTCVKSGKEVYKCNCGEIGETTLPKKGHQFVYTKTIEATCDKDGKKVFRCECGNEEYTVIKKLGHNCVYIETIMPTCTKDGKEVYRCKCGYEDNVLLKKTGHDYRLISRVDPTCLNVGKETYRCKCGQENEVVLSKLEHNYTFSNTIESTCTKEGKHIYKCVCGSERYNPIAKKEHECKLVSRTESTTTVKGKETYQCKNCSYSYVVELPLKLTALDTDMCGESLLNKPLPHAPHYEMAKKMFEMINAKPTQDEALKMGIIPFTSEEAKNGLFDWYGDTYRYASTLYWYTKYTYNRPDYPDGVLVWGDDEIYAEEKAVHDEIYRILAELKIDKTVTQKEAIIRINDYLCENRFYEYDMSKKDGSLYHSIFGGYGVCHNYALAFQLLCLGAGIECHYYSADTMNHAWNKVYFSDGSYYWVDVCWNDAQYKLSNGTVVETSVANGVPAKRVKEIRSRYLLITTEQLLKDHTL